jgi:RNA polymerase sigma-70 factor, ECF subfamily
VVYRPAVFLLDGAFPGMRASSPRFPSIKPRSAGHGREVLQENSVRALSPGLDRPPADLTVDSPLPKDRTATMRFRSLVETHHDFVWRSLRRFGVPVSDLDDAAQEVFMVAARRLEDFVEERERAFLYGTASRVASTRRRGLRRHPEDASDQIDERPAEELDPEELNELRLARPLLQEILDAMGEEVRAVFVLAEIEELPTREIAGLLDVPLGTVSSRLRAGREEFQAAVRRLAARQAFAQRKR